jgi:hypothetical protein
VIDDRPETDLERIVCSILRQDIHRHASKLEDARDYQCGGDNNHQESKLQARFNDRTYHYW